MRICFVMKVASATDRSSRDSCWRGSEAHLMNMLETPDGPLRAASESVQSLFAGQAAVAEDAA